MQFARDGLGSGLRTQANHDVRQLLMNNEDAFNLFLEEAKRKGVRLSMEEPIGSLSPANVTPMNVKEAKKAVSPNPEISAEKGTIVNRAVVRMEPTSSQDAESVSFAAQEEILRKLKWNSSESSTSRNLSTLLDRIKEMGIEDPNSYLSLRDAAQKSGVAERTLRRYIADGQLETEKVKGPRGWEHRVYVPALFSVLQEKAGAFERARSNPLEEMGRELATLCRAIVEQQSLADRRTNRLLDEIKNQGRVMDELRNEQKETRNQMLALQEQMIKALLPPPRQSLFQKWFSKI